MITSNTSYDLMVRRAVDLFAIDVFIMVGSFTPGGRGTSTVGFADLRIEVAKDSEKGVELMVPSCPVYRKDGQVYVRLPELTDGGSIYMSDRYSEAELQKAFRRDCNLLVKMHPELRPLLGEETEGGQSNDVQ